MAHYQRLFDPPSQDDLEYLPDPLGRLDMGSHVEKPSDIPDPGWDAARGDWMDGAPLGQIFGGRLFDLQSGVGAGQANRRGDVFKLQALLHREGVLDAAATEGPTGYWGGRDDYALRKFQKENGLAIDGYAVPGGETIRMIKSFYTPPAPPGIRTMEKRDDDPEPQLRPIGLGVDQPVKPTLLSGALAGGGSSGATGVAPAVSPAQETAPAGVQYAQAGPVTDAVPSEAKPEERLEGWIVDAPRSRQLQALAEKNAALKKAGREGDGEYLYSDYVREGTDRQQCVALVRKVLPGIGASPTWKEGKKLKAEGDPPLQPGTAIATFKDGKYPGMKTGNHAAIFLGYDEHNGRKGIRVLDQFVGHPAMERFIPFDDKAKSMSRNAGAFSVIQRPAK